jgi:outer membrane protein
MSSTATFLSALPSFKSFKFTRVACALSLLACGQAFAVVDAPVREAIDAVNAKQPQKAYDLLQPLEATRAGDPDFDTAFGIAANEVGQFARAIFALERVLVIQPDNARARAELARALFAVGDNKNARKLLEETKAQGVPLSVNQTIDEFLQAIDKVDDAGKSSMRAYFEAVLGNDSNVNSGPNLSSFAVPLFGGAVFTLLPAAQKKSASYLQLAAGATGRVPLAPRWSFIGNAHTTLRRHANNASDYNLNQVDGSGGFSYRNERHEYSGVVTIGHTEIGGSTLRNLSGLTGEWTYRPDGTRQWGTYLQMANLSYPSQRVRDARRSVVGTSYANQLGSGLLYFAGGYTGREAIENKLFPHLGHRMTGLRVGFQMPIDGRWSAFGTASLERRTYGGQDPQFLVTRRDNQMDLTIGASWKFDEKWTLKPQVSINKNNSNVVINDSRRTTLSVVARYEF